LPRIGRARAIAFAVAAGAADMQIASLRDVIAEFVRDGQTIALEGFTHLIPFAAGHEIIRQQRRDLHLVRMTPDLIYDQMIGMGCARALTFSWGGNAGVGSLHRLRDAVENDWPRPLEIHEHSHAGMAVAYTAGAARLPFGMLRGYSGTDLPNVNPQIRSVTCPYTNENLATVPALNPDVTILHAQTADRHGNVRIDGIVGAAKEAALAARTLIVTVEQIVDDIGHAMNATVLPHFVVAAIAEVPRGAYPSYAHGRYARDNAFYLAWDAIARDRDTFTRWMQCHVLDCGDHAQHLRALERAAA
jgi:glutaconate CoA-transferase subunit A